MPRPDRYTPSVSTPRQRSAYADPGTASSLLRQGAASTQFASQSLVQAAQNQTSLELQQIKAETTIAKYRRDVNIAYQADDARLQFDEEMRTFLRTAPEHFADRPEDFYDEAQLLIRKRAEHISTTAFDAQTQTNYARFENDPDAVQVVRGDLFQRGQQFLQEADAITTKLAVARHQRTIAKAEDRALLNAERASSPVQVAQAIADMSGTYARAAGTTLSADEAVTRTRKFSDQMWLKFYDSVAADDPDTFISKQAFGRTPTYTDAGRKQLQETTYTALLQRKGETSETTITNILQLGNLSVDQYKDLLKEKGLDKNGIADRLYAYALSEVAAGKVGPNMLPERVLQWTADGMGREQINGLKSAVLDYADRAIKASDRVREEREKFSRQQGEIVEAKVYEQIMDGKVERVEEIRPLLQLSLEARSLTAQRKNEIEQIAANMIAAGGRGDAEKRIRYELDIRMSAGSHSPVSIRKDPTLNRKEMSELIQILESEAAKERRSPKDRQVYDQERRNVGILYGDKGPMAAYTDAEARTLVSAYQRYDDLVDKFKLNPRDAYKRLTQELHTLTMTQRTYQGLTLPPIAQVQEWAEMVRKRQPLPPGLTPDLIRDYVERYRNQDTLNKLVPPPAKK